MILLYVITGIVVALIIAVLLPRRIALFLGLTALLLGIALPIGLWTYAEFFVPGDKSAQGMLGTICVVLFAPAGILITLFAAFKK